MTGIEESFRDALGNAAAGSGPPAARLRVSLGLHRLRSRPRLPATHGGLLVVLVRLPPRAETQLPRLRASTPGELRSAGAGPRALCVLSSFRSPTRRGSRGRGLRRAGPIPRPRGQAEAPARAVSPDRRPDGGRSAGFSVRRRIRRARGRAVSPVVGVEEGLQPGHGACPTGRAYAGPPVRVRGVDASLVPVRDRQETGPSRPHLVCGGGVSIAARVAAVPAAAHRRRDDHRRHAGSVRRSAEIGRCDSRPGSRLGARTPPELAQTPESVTTVRSTPFFCASRGVSSYILGSGIRIMLVALPALRFGASLRRGIVRFGGAADFGAKGEAGATSEFTAKNFLTMR